MKLLTDITTGKDNQTHDIARVIMVVNAVILVIVLVLAVAMYVYGYLTGKPFPIQDFLVAVLTYVGGVAALLTSGSASIYFKRTTEPDGASSETENITKGKQPDIKITENVL